LKSNSHSIVCMQARLETSSLSYSIVELYMWSSYIILHPNLQNTTKMDSTYLWSSLCYLWLYHFLQLNMDFFHQHGFNFLLISLFFFFNSFFDNSLCYNGDWSVDWSIATLLLEKDITCKSPLSLACPMGEKACNDFLSTLEVN